MYHIFLAWDKTAFQIGGFAIQWYAVLIALGAAIGYYLFQKETQKMGISEDDSLDLIFWGVIVGLIGARIYYVIFKWDYYLWHPDQILNIRGGGMAIYGGVLAGSLALYFLAKKKDLSLISIFDAASPAMLIAQSIGRWGNFVNQEAHGGEVTRKFLEGLYLPEWLIDQMYIESHYYHPTFLYESLWNFIGCILILWGRRYIKGLLHGEIMAFYLLWYGLGRAIIEGMRTDSLYLGPLRVSQWLSIIMIIFALIWIIKRRKQNNPVVVPYRALLNGNGE